MKSIILSLVLAFTLGVSKAATLPTIKEDVNKSFVLNLKDWNKSDLEVSIISEDGLTIFSETLKEFKPSRKYNLKYLTAGNYSIKLSDDYKIITYTINVNNSDVVINEDEKVVFRPFIKYSKDAIDINVLALGNEVNISLIDANGNEIFNEKRENEKTIAKRLNISELRSGEYSVSVKVNDFWYSQLITK